MICQLQALCCNGKDEDRPLGFRPWDGLPLSTGLVPLISLADTRVRVEEKVGRRDKNCCQAPHSVSKWHQILLRVTQLNSEQITFFFSLLVPRATPCFCNLDFWAVKFLPQPKGSRAAWMERESLGMGWQGHDPATFPEVLLPFPHCYPESMFALRIMGNRSHLCSSCAEEPSETCKPSLLSLYTPYSFLYTIKENPGSLQCACQRHVSWLLSLPALAITFAVL